MITATPATQIIRVLLIYDDVVMRLGLRMLVENCRGLKVVGEATNPADALDITAREQPDIILLDSDLDSNNGLDLLPKLHASARQARVLVLTGERDDEVYLRAMRLGASGLVLKDQAAEVLSKAIEKIHAGEVWFDRLFVGSLIAELLRAAEDWRTSPEAARIGRLTEREREVIDLVGEGLKNKQIASRMSISETTVRHHLTSIFNKLGVSDRLELVIYAYHYGLAKVRHLR